jgi:hypothetical protein
MKQTTESELSVRRAMLHSCPTPPPADVVIDLPEDYELPRAGQRALLRLLLAADEQHRGLAA